MTRRIPAAVVILAITAVALLTALSGPGCFRAGNQAKPKPQGPAAARAEQAKPGDLQREASSVEGTSLPPPVNPVAPAQGSFRIIPISPGVHGSNVLQTGQLQIRAIVEGDKSREPSCIRLELNGRLLPAEVIEPSLSSVDYGKVRKLLVRSKPGSLSDGEYMARLRVKDKEGRWSEEEWSFSVSSSGTRVLEDGMDLTLYFDDRPLAAVGFPAEWGFVTPIQRRVEKTPRPALRAVEELIKGPRPEDGEVGRSVPSTARVIGLSIRDGVAYLTFSEEFSRDHWGGTLGGAITTQSLLYTLTEFETVDAVQVLVEGEPWSDGHFVWDEPWPRPSPKVQRLQVDDCD